MSIGIANDDWLFAWAKNIQVAIFVPEGSTCSFSSMKEGMIDLGALHGGGGVGGGFTITVSNNITSENHTITIKVSGDNIPQEISLQK